MFNLLVLAMGVFNVVLYTINHQPLNLAAGIFAIVVFIATANR